jgi:hypothetical protein
LDEIIFDFDKRCQVLIDSVLLFFVKPEEENSRGFIKSDDDGREYKPIYIEIWNKKKEETH